MTDAAPLPTLTPGPDGLRRILRATRTIAMVGVSPNPVRPSNYVGRYLALKGFRVIPVNPVQAGKRLWGQEVRASLADIPGDLPDADGLLALMAQDKKVKAGALTFILARGVGEAFVTRDVPREALSSLLTDALAARG